VQYKHPNKKCGITLQEKDRQKNYRRQASAKANDPDTIR
jgi:hypothetical protein